MVDLESSSSSPNDDQYFELNQFQNYNSIPLLEYNENEVQIKDWAYDHFNNPGIKILNYIKSIFPIHKWILHYNFAWLYSDVVAGITVGVVMVPQSMSYAQIATLDPQFGLYSAFVGVFIYCFFATSKDVCIGPVAVMSLEVSKVIAKVQEKDPNIKGEIIATVLALICGCIAIGLGLLRLGFILEFISMPAVLGFMTGSAFSIVTGQIPGLMGYSKLVNTRTSAYKVVINTTKHLPDTKLDAVFGLIPLFLLYLWRTICNYGPKRYPKLRPYFFYIQALRNGIILIIFTAISYGITKNHKNNKKITVLGSIPKGLQNVGLMKFPENIMTNLAPELPAAAIVLFLEHISISKSFGRINDYKIVPDQELIAIGATNLIGTFFNAYPATGSFSRSALKAKCNVKTPLSGIYTGACVLLALYCLTGAFYYIPKATLSAVIIHAVGDLFANYTTTLSLWKSAPIDAGIFIIAVFLTIFTSIENGIYFAICASCAVLLFNVAFPNGEFLGRVKVAQVLNPDLKSIDDISSSNDSSDFNNNNNYNNNDQTLEIDFYKNNDDIDNKNKIESIKSSNQKNNFNKIQSNNLSSKNIQFVTKWVPLKKTNLNKDLDIKPPPKGVLVFKPLDSWTYINCSRQFDKVFEEVKLKTKKGKINHSMRNIDKPWNDPGPLIPFWKKQKSTDLPTIQQQDEISDQRPILKILVFDFSSVSQIDSTGIQSLIDLRKAINKYSDREIEYHFAGIISPWIRKSLINNGFGIEKNDARVNYNYVDIIKDEEAVFGYNPAITTNTPYFHLDIPSFDDFEEEI